MSRIKRNVRKARYVLYRETLIDTKDHFFTFIGAFTGIGLISLLQMKIINGPDNLFLIGSFGASAVLVFGIVNSPLAQPRNLIGGHLISAMVGVTIARFLPHSDWFAPALAVSVSIVLMQITKTLHPPGGATALIAVIGSEQVKSLGFLYILSPVLSGVVILFVVAVLCNNFTESRSYPSKNFRLLKSRMPRFRKMPAMARNAVNRIRR